MEPPAAQNNVWYTVDRYIRRNTPGVQDGSIAAYIDKRLVENRSGTLSRLADSLHAGGAWFDFHYGGSGVALTAMWVDIDDMVWGAMTTPVTHPSR